MGGVVAVMWCVCESLLECENSRVRRFVLLNFFETFEALDVHRKDFRESIIDTRDLVEGKTKCALALLADCVCDLCRLRLRGVGVARAFCSCCWLLKLDLLN